MLAVFYGLLAPRHRSLLAGDPSLLLKGLGPRELVWVEVAMVTPAQITRQDPEACCRGTRAAVFVMETELCCPSS